jgi:hypothetical protein
MKSYQFHDEYTLAETAEELGKKAVKLGLIPSLCVRIFPIADNSTFPTKTNPNP